MSDVGDCGLGSSVCWTIRKVAEVYSIDRRREISPRQYRYEDGRYILHPGANVRHANVARLICLTRSSHADNVLSDVQ